jgi:HEAT repeat protein
MGRRGGPGDRLVDWIVPEASAVDTAPQTAEDIYRMADRLPDDLEKQLDECLNSGDWRLQLAAADVAGQFDVQSAVPALLHLLEDEAAKPPHPGLSRSWSESKMNEALKAEADYSPDNTIDPVESAKRYRLTQALIIALGRLGDTRAVAPLERIMARGTDFFPALAQVPVALARLGSPGSVAVLQLHKDHGEINVRTHVRLALDFLNGEISGREFEVRINPS